jgi:branched-chain amino acid transport system ATP-binding protein
MALLKVQSVSQAYGGLKILEDINFEIVPGERVALIGPNGAGKTTFINVLSGVIPAKGGEISFLGENVTHMPAYARAQMGLARSFQVNTLFTSLTLLENVLLAIQGMHSSRFRMGHSLRSYGQHMKQAKDLLDLMQLWHRRDECITNLSYGEQRQVEILLPLASKPKMLVLDEPSAGLSKAESGLLIDIMKQLPSSLTYLFVAHDMDVVFALAQRILVLYYGEILAEGTPAEIQAHPTVREIYLGVE